jgi:L-2-hydroxyglutarate oxidase LhgO
VVGDQTGPGLDGVRPDTGVVVVGGGFFGLYLAEHMALRGFQVVVCEREERFMTRASYVNQARVHNGYHYPRSILTAHRSAVNFPRFVEEFEPCIERSFEQLYAIGRDFSKVSANQYRLFMQRVGVPIAEPRADQVELFDPRRVEAVFVTEEYAFDAVELASLMVARAEKAGVELLSATEVVSVARDGARWMVETRGRGGRERTIEAESVLGHQSPACRLRSPDRVA